MNLGIPSPTNQSWYEIRVQGRIDRRWAAWMEGMTVTPDTDGTTLIHGPVADQPALHGLLSRLRDLGLPLISFNRADHSGTPDETCSHH